MVLIVLWRARPAFDRRAAFFDTRFSAAWIAALVGALGASVWLGLFAFKHVDYSHELWWQFELQGEASRFLRASVGAALVLLLFGFARLVGYAPHEAPTPTTPISTTRARVIAAQSATFPFLVYLRDKALLFNDARTAFVMYGVQGRTWVALGDPVGPERSVGDLIRRFSSGATTSAACPVFYEVGKAHLHLYADFGLTFVKLGEEAKVDLSRRSRSKAATIGQVSPGASDGWRRTAARSASSSQRTFQRSWASCAPCPTTGSPPKASAEKGFSLGFFDEAYVARFPVAVIERDGRIQAFANIWRGRQPREMSDRSDALSPRRAARA